jgi:ACR3 family arsenite efflux pump ArsB
VVLVAVNSLLQMLLFAPLSCLFTVVLGGGASTELLGIWFVSKNVLLYLGLFLEDS